MQIKRYASLLLLAGLVYGQSYGQNEKIFNRLNSLYTLDKYEECIAKAESYMKDSKDAKDAYPYLYASMSYFAIHQNAGQYDKKYKDALRKAVMNSGKFVKRDKNEELKSESNGFMGELRKATLNECAYLLKNEDPRGLQNLSREVIKQYPKDFAFQLSAGTYMLYAAAKAEGEKAVQAALDSLKKKTPVTDPLFQVEYADAFLLYTGYLAEAKDVRKAKDVIQFASTFLPENEAIKNEYDKLYNTEATKKAN